jgi:chemotaxis protein CheC
LSAPPASDGNREAAVPPLLSDDKRDALGEIVNIGMGVAGSALAQVLDAFVELSVPSVDLVDRRRIATLLDTSTPTGEELIAVRQSFFGRIMGESLILFDGSEATRLSDLVGHDEAPTIGHKHELLLDLANIVIGACVNGIAEPLHEIVSFAAPAMLIGRPKVCEFAMQDSGTWQRGLVINVDFTLEARSFHSRVLVFLAEQSLELIDREISRFLDELGAS